MQTTVERRVAGFRDYVGRGPVVEVVPWARKLSTRPDMELVYAPKPDPVRPGWVVVRVRLRGDVQPSDAPRQAAPVRRSVPVPARRTATPPATVWPRVGLRERPAVQRDWSPLVKPALIVGGTLAGLAGVAWLVAQVVRGAVAAVAPHAGWLVLVAVLALVGWLMPKGRSRGSSGGGGGGCPGVVHHCSRCPDH